MLAMNVAVGGGTGGYFVSYTAFSENGEKSTKSVMISSSYKGDTTLTNGIYYVAKDTTITKRITVTGNVTLIIRDGKTLNASAGITVNYGDTLTITVGRIQSTKSTSGTSTIEGTGKLVATSTTFAAAIGGSTDVNSCGTVNIYGGNVTATGNSSGSGIGSTIGGSKGDSSDYYSGTVNIYGGNVTATGGSTGGGAGIGGGRFASGGTVNIYGGTITANGNGYGAGIGGGQDGTGGIVNIYGGTVTATGGSNGGAGIGGGGGYYYTGNMKIAAGVKGTGGTVNITGGIVKATSTKGACIGGGSDATGGTLTVKGDSAEVFFVHKSSGKTFTSTGAVKLTPTSSDKRALVEYGDSENYGNLANGMKGTALELDSTSSVATSPYAHIFFDNLNVNACYYTTADGTSAFADSCNVLTASVDTLESGYWVVKESIVSNSRIYVDKNNVTLILLDGVTLDASKGGIEVKEGGTLTITTGNTTENIEGTGKLIAEGSETGQAGIGGGDYYSNGTVNIYGGTITATGNTDAAGIGGGFDGKGGTVNITGGTITATGNGYATGIGGCKYRGGGTVTITGGKVTATAGETASAIGGGSAGVSSAGSLSISGTADVTVKSASGSKYYALSCDPATATPPEGYSVIVQDEDGNNFAGTPSSKEVDLVKIGLNDSLYYAHIFFGTDYTVTFDANGGTGTMDTVSAKAGEAVSTTNKFENNGKVFYEWNTKADGSGTAYEEAESACFASDITLYAQWGELACYYTDKKGNAQLLIKENANILTDSIANSGNELASGFWVVEDNITTTKRIYVNTNDVTLILLDGVTLDASTGGIEVKDGGTLTITTGNTTEDIKGTGKLIAKGEAYQAGIGGDSACVNGIVNIYGGTISATGNTDAAGIGGGCNGKGGTVNITGGTVTATGNGYGTGIGGGRSGAGCTVTITGGKVTATAGETASAIGGGSNLGSGPGSISISGTADVTVKSLSSGYYALYCNQATATPPEGYSVIVKDEAGNNFDGTPSSTEVDLGKLRLNDSLYYAHIFFGSDFTVIFNANGGKGEMDTLSAEAGEYKILPENGFTRDDYYFLGWNTAANGTGTTYNVGDTVRFHNAITLYAQWKSIYCDTYYKVFTEDGKDSIAQASATLYLGSKALSKGIYYVNEDTTLTERIKVTGAVTLILGDDVTLTDSAGISVEKGNTLTITVGGDSEDFKGSGKLIATSDDYRAAIGGGLYVTNTETATAGTVNIYGGTVEATSRDGAAGIGGGYYGSCGQVNIYAGTVTATSDSGAGIGGGEDGIGRSTATGGEVNIYGGTVEATSKSGVGIGGGYYGKGGTVNISGGTVVATSTSGAGIGAYFGYAGKVTITGDSAVVTATGKVAFSGTTLKATGKSKGTVVEYGDSATATNVKTFSAFAQEEVNLLTIGNESDSLVSSAYAHIYFQDKKEIISCGQYKFKSYCSSNPLEFDENGNYMAYTATYKKVNNDSIVVTLTKCAKVPANTGVIIYNPDLVETDTIAIGAEDFTLEDKNKGNKLVGVIDATFLNQTDGDYTNFFLSAGEPQAFVKVQKDGGTLGANRAYLPILTSDLSSSNAKVYISFEGSGTGINEVNSATKNGKIYNLQGIEISEPAKGLYIKNGRKIVK